jgi:RNA polymerase sigma factor (sigma-70 family)
VDETDEQVVGRSEAGDPADFMELFWHHGQAVHAYLARRAGRQDADDLLSGVWLRAFKGRTSRRGPDALPWLYGIARNVLRAHWQQSARSTSPTESPKSSDPWPEIDNRLDAAANGASLQEFLATLTGDERDVLLLVIWEQLTPAEAAVVLGIPQGTARSRLHRALSALRATGAFNASVLACSPTKEV